MNLFLSLLFLSVAQAREFIVVLQSDSLEEYSVPAKSFIKNWKGKAKSYSLHGKKENAIKIAKDLKRDPPPLIFAVGAKAAWTARTELPNVPLIYAMVQNPRRYGIAGENVIGIGMEPAADLTLSQLQLFSPKTKTIAFFVSKSSNPAMVTKATETANSLGLQPVKLTVETTRELRKELARVPDLADAIWLLPDAKIITPENFYHISNTAMRARMPSISTSRHLTNAGALFSVSANHKSVGKQAAQLALKVLMGDKSYFKTEIPPEETHVALNRDTQEAIGLEIEDFILDFVTEIVSSE